MDEAFKKAQKPWAKFLQKVERTRLEYHTACKQERTAQNQERNASGDSSLSPDQVSGCCLVYLSKELFIEKSFSQRVIFPPKNIRRIGVKIGC